MKLPSIVPKSQFSKVFLPVTLAGIKIPLFKLTTSTEFENDKLYKGHQTV